MSDRWSFKQRQAWIDETVRIFGFINRVHIERKFEVSTPQASVDIHHFIDAHPGVIAYNKSTKRYEACASDENGTTDPEETTVPKLHVIYDPQDKISAMPGELQEQLQIKVAILSIPKDLKSVDIYNLAKRLAELLLEQV